jgi:hypothetical protein
MSLINFVRPKAEAIFAHHVGVGPGIEGYVATPWRDWLICNPSCNTGWFVVKKAKPLAKPRYFPCSLKDCKAILLAGR